MSNAYRSTLAGGGSAVGDATASDVLTGKTFSGAVGSGVTGTMPNNGAVSGQATPSQPYTIPAGYHNGSGIVTANSGTITQRSGGTQFNAVAGDYIFASDPSASTGVTVNGHLILGSELGTSILNNAIYVLDISSSNTSAVLRVDTDIELTFTGAKAFQVSGCTLTT